MRCATKPGLLLVLAACGARINGEPASLGNADAAIDPVALDAAAAPSDAVVLGAWSPAAKVAVAATAASEDDVALSSNTLEMVFAIDASNGDGTAKDLFYTSRASATAPWATATKLPFDSAMGNDQTPRFSADDKTLYFATARAGNGTLDIYQVTRDAAGSTAWGKASPLAAVNTTTMSEKWFSPCGTDHYVMVQGTPTGQTDLVEGALGVAGSQALIDELNSPENDTSAFITQDCLTIYFASTRTMPTTIFRSQRPAVTAKWAAPTPVLDFAAPNAPGGNQEDPWISPDARTFAFVSDAAGTKDVYLSTR